MEHIDYRRGPRPGGRSAKVRSAVLSAAFGILQRSGLEALTIAGVAQTSGIHATTIYRRWKTPAALALDATIEFAGVAVGTPDTGSLKSDLIALVRNVAAVLESPTGNALLGLCHLKTPEAAEARRHFWQARLDASRIIFDRAFERREITDTGEAATIVEGLVAPLYLRALVTGMPLADWPIEKFVDRILTCSASGESPDHKQRR